MNKYAAVITNIKKIASDLFKEKKGEVYLYGSQARMDATPYSDWDLLILTEEILDKEEIFNKYGFPFCEIGWYLEEDINPLVFTKKEWEAQKQSFFYFTVMNDAIKLYS